MQSSKGRMWKTRVSITVQTVCKRGFESR